MQETKKIERAEKIDRKIIHFFERRQVDIVDYYIRKVCAFTDKL